jgi:hypothetical protein
LIQQECVDSAFTCAAHWATVKWLCASPLDSLLTARVLPSPPPYLRHRHIVLPLTAAAVTSVNGKNSATSLTATAIGGYAGVYTHRDDDGVDEDSRWITAMGSINMPLRASMRGSGSVLNVLVQGTIYIYYTYT